MEAKGGGDVVVGIGVMHGVEGPAGTRVVKDVVGAPEGEIGDQQKRDETESALPGNGERVTRGAEDQNREPGVEQKKGEVD